MAFRSRFPDGGLKQSTRNIEKMKNTKRIAIILVLIGLFCGTFALAQTAAPKVDEFQAQAQAATAKRLSKLIRYYKPSDQQKAKLKEILVVQYKDITDHDKVRAPKIQAMDDEIAALQKEITAIEKRKAAHAEARAELLLDHKAEINGVFTPEQKIARLSNHIRSSAVTSTYFTIIPQASQDSISKQSEAAAMKLIEEGKSEDTTAIRAAYMTIRDGAKTVVTPEVRITGDANNLLSSIMRQMRRIKLADAQQAAVRDLCEKAAKRRVEMYDRYAQISKDLAAVARVRRAMSSRNYYSKIRDEVVNKVLTDEQVKAGGFKRK